MRTIYFLIFCAVVIVVSGCAVGMSRTGYSLPPGVTSKNLSRRPIAIQCNAKYDTNDVIWLGSIHDYDTGLSTDCDEATILDTFCKEGTFLGADLINITEEKQPSPWTSTCYRAKADFLRLKDREKAKNLVSDAKYAPNLIIKRSAEFGTRNIEVITAGVLAGPLGILIVASATEPNNHSSDTNSIPNSTFKKP